MLVRCSKCGLSVGNGASVCGHCGRKVESPGCLFGVVFGGFLAFLAVIFIQGGLWIGWPFAIVGGLIWVAVVRDVFNI